MQKYKIVLKRSLIGCTKQQKMAVWGLGLKKIQQEIIVPINPVTKGQINKAKHLLSLKLMKNEQAKKIVKSQ